MHHGSQINLVVGILVGISVLLTFGSRLFVKMYRAIERAEKIFGVDAHGKTLRDEVTALTESHGKQTTDLESVKMQVAALHSALNNGIRAEIAQAVIEAREARRLAGEAASAASSAHLEAIDARRASAAARADISIIGDAVATDSAKVWDALSDLGIDRRRPTD